MSISYVIFGSISENIESQKEYGDLRPKSALYGIYNAVTVIRNKDTVPPLTTDTTRWKQLIIQFEKYSTVKLMNDSIQYFNFVVDTMAKTVTIYNYADTLNKSKFSYVMDSSYLILNGMMSKDSLYMKFKKIDLNSFRLLNRGFHWINEYPYL
jgi:hypothetical protein